MEKAKNVKEFVERIEASKKVNTKDAYSQITDILDGKTK